MIVWLISLCQSLYSWIRRRRLRGNKTNERRCTRKPTVWQPLKWQGANRRRFAKTKSVRSGQHKLRPIRASEHVVDVSCSRVISYSQIVHYRRWTWTLLGEERWHVRIRGDWLNKLCCFGQLARSEKSNWRTEVVGLCTNDASRHSPYTLQKNDPSLPDMRDG